MKRVLCGVALSALAALPVHAAERCSLPRVASFDLKRLPDGEYTIPISIGGVERKFIVSLSAPLTAISGAVADAQGLKTSSLQELRPNLYGETVDRKVVVTDLAIGVAHAKNYEVLRADKAFAGKGVDGLAGQDLLKNFDVELDLSALKLNLFSPNDCDYKVYWATSYADARLKSDASGHTAFGMFLDGTYLTVDLDVQDGDSLIGTNTLKRLFYLTPQSPGMVAETRGETAAWRYPFKTLALGGVTINNPHIAIIQQDGPECRPDMPSLDANVRECYGVSNLRLLGDVLKALHIYFAYKDKKAYITAADAHL